MLTVGDQLPDFRLRAVAGGEKGCLVTPASFPDRWLVLLYWPTDLALVCASEIDEIHRRHADLVAQGAQAVGAGQDIGPLGLGWAARQGLRFPLLDDAEQSLARALGLVRHGDGGNIRATFVADPSGRIRWVRVSDLSAGRFMPEVLQALASARDSASAGNGTTRGACQQRAREDVRVVQEGARGERRLEPGGGLHPALHGQRLQPRHLPGLPDRALVELC